VTGNVLPVKRNLYSNKPNHNSLPEPLTLNPNSQRFNQRPLTPGPGSCFNNPYPIPSILNAYLEHFTLKPNNLHALTELDT